MNLRDIKYIATLMIVSVQLLFSQVELKPIADKAASILLTGKDSLKGIVIGIIKGEQKAVFSYGQLVKNNKDIKAGEMLFEIASITKNLTALLLAQSVSDGVIKYDDTAITIDKKNITWKQLATHTSGLPVNVNNSQDYITGSFEKFLEGCHLVSEPGSHFIYSTAGYSLLGKLLASKRGYKSYDVCLNEIVLKPLGFLSSVFDNAGINKDFYTGDTLLLKNRKKDFVFNPSGGLISTADDLLTLIRANLKPEEQPQFTNAIKMTQQTFKDIPTFPGSIAALG
jgi:CubicO group peptidase (beta-lactamase class C family)